MKQNCEICEYHLQTTFLTLNYWISILSVLRQASDINFVSLLWNESIMSSFYRYMEFERCWFRFPLHGFESFLIMNDVKRLLLLRYPSKMLLFFSIQANSIRQTCIFERVLYFSCQKNLVNNKTQASSWRRSVINAQKYTRFIFS